MLSDTWPWTQWRASIDLVEYLQLGLAPTVVARGWGGEQGDSTWGSIGFIVTVLMSTSHTYRLLR